MAFDESKDKTLASVVAFEGEDSKITVSIRQYNGGEEKVQISRDLLKGDKFEKLGRLTFEEMDGVLRAFNAAYAQAGCETRRKR
ncbi:MAG: hypothetical protein ABSH28_01765 [Acidobacteriota bacterium]|jgi:hypothetical protein